MARFQVVKGAVNPTNIALYSFTRDLVACVGYACLEVAREISSQPEAAFGTDARVGRASGTPGSLAAENFATAAVASHANAYARHFLSIGGRTVRMDLGNLVEQRAIACLRAYTGWGEGFHYLYQASTARPPRFPINYVGASATARPDIRYELPNGEEAVFDITTPLQAGHLLHKRIGGQTIGGHSKIPVAVEIIWEDADLYHT